MTIKEIFGANLKYYRKKTRLSQEQLSEKVNISPKHLSKIETGDAFVSAELLENLTRILGVSASVLFYSSKENSVDDSLLTLVDTTVDRELAKAVESIKLSIRQLR